MQSENEIVIEHVRFQKYMVKDKNGVRVEADQTENIRSEKPHLFVGFLNSATIVLPEIVLKDGTRFHPTTTIRKANVTFFFKTATRAAGFSVSMKGEKWKTKQGDDRFTAFLTVDPVAYKALMEYISAHRDVLTACREQWEFAKSNAPS